MTQIRTSDTDTTCEFPYTVSSFRLDQQRRAVVLRFAAGGTAWELTLPDENVNFSTVRVTVRELGSQRGAEASVLLPWTTYTRARDWLRCLPDGCPPRDDIQPALIYLYEAFTPILSALSIFM
jgi:hypothetical protein